MDLNGDVSEKVRGAAECRRRPWWYERKGTAMDAARRGVEAHTRAPARNSYSGGIQISKGSHMCHFHRTLILDDPSVRGIHTDVAYNTVGRVSALSLSAWKWRTKNAQRHRQLSSR
jgi:hypothetical protein